MPAALKVSASSQTLPQIVAKREINNKSDDLLLCLPACRHGKPRPIDSGRGSGFLWLRACSQLLVYILNETASEAFACLRFVLCSAPLRSALTARVKGESDLRLGSVGVTLCHTGSAFGRSGEGGVCLHGGEVSQAEADEAGEQFAALLNLS